MRLAIRLLILIGWVNSTMAQTGNETFLVLNSRMHTAPIYKVRSDSKGQYILTCSTDKTAKLWDARTGELVRTYRVPINTGNDGMIYSCAISPDDKLVLLGIYTGTKETRSIYVLDFLSGEVVKVIYGIDDTILDMEFSADAKYLAVAFGRNYEVLIFNTNDWTINKRLGGFKKRIQSLSFDGAGRLVMVSFDKQIRLYDAKFELIKQRELFFNMPLSIDFTKDGSKIALAYYENCKVEVLNGNTLELEYTPVTTSKDSVGCEFERVCWSFDNKYLYSTGHCWNDPSMDKPVLIRRWDNAGKGNFIDIPSAYNRNLDIIPLPDNAIAYCSVQPEMGVLKSDSTKRFYHLAEILSLGTDEKEQLRINSNGKELGFINYDNGLPYVFSLKDKRLFQKKYGLQAYNDNSENLTITDWLNSTKPKINDSIIKFLKPNEMCRTVDISDDSKNFVIGTSWNLYCCDTLGKIKWKTVSRADIWSLNIAKNNKVVVVTQGDGLIDWYRMTDGKLLLSLFIHPDTKRWVLWTSRGYFTCSEGGDELIGWHVNNGLNKAPSFYPAKNFFDQYYRPDIIDEIFVNYETDEEILVRKSNTLISVSSSKQPPLIKLTQPNGIEWSEKDRMYQSKSTSVKLNFSLTDQGGGFDEIRLFQNNKLIETTSRGFKPTSTNGQTINKTFDVNLVVGENLITISSFSADRIESNPLTVKINYVGNAPKPNLFILAIGINNYSNSNYNLSYALSDAQSCFGDSKKWFKRNFC
jgi:WD40 repeat protein